MSRKLEHRNIAGLMPEEGSGTREDPCVATHEVDGATYRVTWSWRDPKKGLGFKSLGELLSTPSAKPKTTRKKKGSRSSGK